MEFLNQLFESNNIFPIELKTILIVLFFTLILSLYEFVVYRFVSSNTIYNKQLNISIITLPFFIATIILALQSNLVITLGTIGALAIIRYRTAIKEPINMTYILWAVHTGIVCGCRLYELGIITSLVVSITVYILEKIKSENNQSILCVKSNKNIEEEIIKILNDNSKNYVIKNRSYVNDSFDFIAVIISKEQKNILDKISSLKNCTQASIVDCS